MNILKFIYILLLNIHYIFLANKSTKIDLDISDEKLNYYKSFSKSESEWLCSTIIQWSICLL